MCARKYLVASHAVLLHLLKLAFQFSLPLTFLLGSAHIHLFPIQLLSIHLIYSLHARIHTHTKLSPKFISFLQSSIKCTSEVRTHSLSVLMPLEAHKSESFGFSTLICHDPNTQCRPCDTHCLNYYITALLIGMLRMVPN